MAPGTRAGAQAIVSCSSVCWGNTELEMGLEDEIGGGRAAHHGCHPQLAFKTSKGDGRDCSLPTEMALIQQACSQTPPPPSLRAVQERTALVPGIHHFCQAQEEPWVG